MTSHLFGHTTTDVKPGICYQVSKPEMEFHMIDIIYVALSIGAQTEKTTFSCKDDCTMTRHTRCWTYSARDVEIPLCHILPLQSFFSVVWTLKSLNGFKGSPSQALPPPHPHYKTSYIWTLNVCFDNFSSF